MVRMRMLKGAGGQKVWEAELPGEWPAAAAQGDASGGELRPRAVEGAFYPGPTPPPRGVVPAAGRGAPEGAFSSPLRAASVGNRAGGPGAQAGGEPGGAADSPGPLELGAAAQALLEVGAGVAAMEPGAQKDQPLGVQAENHLVSELLWRGRTRMARMPAAAALVTGRRPASPSSVPPGPWQEVGASSEPRPSTTAFTATSHEGAPFALAVLDSAIQTLGAGSRKLPSVSQMRKSVPVWGGAQAATKFLKSRGYVRSVPGAGLFVADEVGTLGDLRAALQQEFQAPRTTPPPGQSSVAACHASARIAITAMDSAIEALGASSQRMPSFRAIRESVPEYGGGEAAMKYLKARGYVRTVPGTGTFVAEDIGTLADIRAALQQELAAPVASYPSGGRKAAHPHNQQPLAAATTPVKVSKIETMLEEASVMRDMCASVMRSAVKSLGKMERSIPKRKELTHLVQQWGRKHNYEISLATAEVVVLPRMLEYLEELGYIEALKLKRPRFVTAEVATTGRLCELLEEAVVNQRAARLGPQKGGRGRTSPGSDNGGAGGGTHGREIGRLLETDAAALTSVCVWMVEGSARLLGGKSTSLPKRRDLTHILQKWGRKNKHDMSLNAADEVVLPRVLKFLEEEGYISPLVLKRPRFVADSVQTLANLSQALKLRLAQLRSAGGSAPNPITGQTHRGSTALESLSDAALLRSRESLVAEQLAPLELQDAGPLSPPAAAVTAFKPWEPETEEASQKVAILLQGLGTRTESGMKYSSRLLRKGLLSIVGALKSFPEGMTREQLLAVLHQDGHLLDHIVQALLSVKGKIGDIHLRKRTIDFDKATQAGENILFFLDGQEVSAPRRYPVLLPKPTAAARPAPVAQPAPANHDQQGAALRDLGCSKCRYSKHGCVRCTRPSFHGRANPGGPAQSADRSTGCSKCRYSKFGCIRCDAQRKVLFQEASPVVDGFGAAAQHAKRKAAGPLHVVREGDGDQSSEGKRLRTTVFLDRPAFNIRNLLEQNPVSAGIFEPPLQGSTPPQGVPLGSVGMDVYVGGLNSLRPVAGRVTHASKKKLVVEIRLD